jgi:hypothetical protein
MGPEQVQTALEILARLAVEVLDSGRLDGPMFFSLCYTLFQLGTTLETRLPTDEGPDYFPLASAAIELGRQVLLPHYAANALQLGPRERLAFSLCLQALLQLKLTASTEVGAEAVRTGLVEASFGVIAAGQGGVAEGAALGMVGALLQLLGGMDAREPPSREALVWLAEGYERRGLEAVLCDVHGWQRHAHRSRALLAAVQCLWERLQPDALEEALRGCLAQMDSRGMDLGLAPDSAVQLVQLAYRLASQPSGILTFHGPTGRGLVEVMETVASAGMEEPVATSCLVLLIQIPEQRATDLLSSLLSRTTRRTWCLALDQVRAMAGGKDSLLDGLAVQFSTLGRQATGELSSRLSALLQWTLLASSLMPSLLAPSAPTDRVLSIMERMVIPYVTERRGDVGAQAAASVLLVYALRILQQALMAVPAEDPPGEVYDVVAKALLAHCQGVETEPRGAVRTEVLNYINRLLARRLVADGMGASQLASDSFRWAPAIADDGALGPTGLKLILFYPHPDRCCCGSEQRTAMGSHVASSRQCCSVSWLPTASRIVPASSRPGGRRRCGA